MDIDEEPETGVNTCSKESRKQFLISISVIFLICNILYVASTIIYTSYIMVIDMDKELFEHGIKPLAIYDTCSEPPIHFNIERLNVTNDVTQNEVRIEWSEHILQKGNVHVLGVNKWNFTNRSTFILYSNTCVNTMFFSRPPSYGL